MSEIVCPNCAHRNAEHARYCASCSVNLGDAAPKDASGRPRYETSPQPSLWARLASLLRGTNAKSSQD
jgi:hypothetical protein